MDLYFPKTEKEGKRYREQPKGTGSGGVALEEDLDTDCLVNRHQLKRETLTGRKMRQNKSENK